VGKAVVQFQNRHGLAPDGAVGRNTLAAINRSPEDLLRTVVVNMERWRWVPRDLGRRRIEINSAAFTLEAFQEGYPVLEMPVIVGEAYTMTPVFSKNMAYLVINPYWDVPPGVLARKILPKIKKSPGYLTANHFELIGGWKGHATLLDPAAVNWSKVHAGNFPGRLRQTPGPWNSLGLIKFIFPNRFDVYMHDTPQRHLFKRRIRTFSSGCIRVQDPVDLALYVLGSDPSWNRTRLEETIAGGKTTVIPVRNPVTVHLFYWTFWMDEEGKAHYCEDIYGRDRDLWEALHSVPGMIVPRPLRPIPEESPNVKTGQAR
jgi:murein L,D-transpeptidase YcbB/YkuD